MGIVTKAALKAKYQTGDFPTEQDFIDFIDTVYPYEKYVALLTQTGTDAPVATVLENTLGGTVVWTYASQGEYRATLAGAFTTSKTFIIYGELNSGYRITAQANSVNMIRVLTYDPTTPFSGSDGRLSETPIEIRVYP